MAQIDIHEYTKYLQMLEDKEVRKEVLTVAK